MSATAIRRLGPEDVATVRALNSLFGAAFEEPETYVGAPPDDNWVFELLGQRHVVVLVAERDGTLAGGLVAYLLPKLGQQRSETYVYDLAVAEPHRRQGIATALLHALGPIAEAAAARTVYVQADPEDAPAVALYTRLGRPQKVFHFDLDLGATPAD